MELTGLIAKCLSPSISPLGRMARNASALERKPRGFSLKAREEVRCLIHSIITLNPIIAHNLPEINLRQVIIMSD